MAEKQKAPNQLVASSLAVPRHVDALVFAAAVAESYTPGADVNYALFSGTVPFYLRIGGTAAAPGADITDGTASIYIPASAQFEVEEGVAISVIPTGAGIVTIAGYTK